MKLVPLKVGESAPGKWVFTWDVLSTLAWLVILLLCWWGVFPWWVVVFYPLTTIKGISIKFRLEK